MKRNCEFLIRGEYCASATHLMGVGSPELTPEDDMCKYGEDENVCPHYKRKEGSQNKYKVKYKGIRLG